MWARSVRASATSESLRSAAGNSWSATSPPAATRCATSDSSGFRSSASVTSSRAPGAGPRPAAPARRPAPPGRPRGSGRRAREPAPGRPHSRRRPNPVAVDIEVIGVEVLGSGGRVQGEQRLEAGDDASRRSGSSRLRNSPSCAAYPRSRRCSRGRAASRVPRAASEACRGWRAASSSRSSSLNRCRHSTRRDSGSANSHGTPPSVGKSAAPPHASRARGARADPQALRATQQRCECRRSRGRLIQGGHSATLRRRIAAQANRGGRRPGQVIRPFTIGLNAVRLSSSAVLPSPWPGK